MTRFDIALIGGDRRTACMAPIFMKKEYRVVCYGTLKIANEYRAHSLKEALENAAIIVGGIPFEKNGCLYTQQDIPEISLAELQRCLRKHQKVFGGVIPESFRRLCEEREIDCYDFMKEEYLAIYNAIATAEGAILEALSHKDTQLHQSPVLLLGYGKCGKVLADKLKGLSACVTVASSDAKELALASSLGFTVLPLSQLQQKIGCFEYLFNTIPACILNRSCLESLNKDSIIIDIASNRVGVDYECAKALNLQALYCPGLPGKYAGISCAGYLVDYVTGKL